jgi:hypothetical protein
MNICSTYTLGILLLFGNAVHGTTNRLFRRAINDPVSEYLFEICQPNLSNAVRNGSSGYSASALSSVSVNSPFPCELEQYIGRACYANGTTENDFVAEQQCLCKGAFFEVMTGCSQCYLAHGFQPAGRTLQDLEAEVESLSIAECAPTPAFQPYTNLTPELNFTSAELAPPLTLGTDHFPNNTAVSNYYKSTITNLLGEITGSATARQRSFTNFEGERFTPTSVPVSSGTGSFTKTSTTQTTSNNGGVNAEPSTTAAVSTTNLRNAGGKAEAQMTARVLLAALGMVALL